MIKSYGDKRNDYLDEFPKLNQHKPPKNSGNSSSEARFLHKRSFQSPLSNHESSYLSGLSSSNDRSTNKLIKRSSSEHNVASLAQDAFVNEEVTAIASSSATSSNGPAYSSAVPAVRPAFDKIIHKSKSTKDFGLSASTSDARSSISLSGSMSSMKENHVSAAYRNKVLESNKDNGYIFSNSNKIRQFMKNNNPVKIYDVIPPHLAPPLHITNQEEVRKSFLEEKIPPVLKFKADNVFIQNLMNNKSKARYDHFFKAKHILDTIKRKFPKGVHSFYEANFGRKINNQECLDILGNYLCENRIDGEISINFAPGLTCAGRIYYHSMINNRPETRKFVVWISNDNDNQFLRENGIVCLCDHELGTHYYRSYNDGLQCWFSERKKYGLRSLDSVELMATEEGLAACHTLMNAKLKYLYLPALFYYLACMAEKMTFEQLYNHMEKYIDMPEERWKLVTRVKRGISDPHAIGCYSRDQCYFEGAIEILENLDNIDFSLLMSGKVCVDELPIIKRLSKVNSRMKVPKFMRDMKAYKRTLREIAMVNGLIEPPDGSKNKRLKELKDRVEKANRIDTKQKDLLLPVIVPMAEVARREPTLVNIAQPVKDLETEKKELLQQLQEIIDDGNCVNPQDIKEYREMFEKNIRAQTMTSIEINKYIATEIVANTKTGGSYSSAAFLRSMRASQNSGDPKDAHSGLCTLL